MSLLTISHTHLRPVTKEDEPFLYKLYASTRQEEMADLNWPQAQQDLFLQMQFRAQQKHYSGQFHQASFEIVMLQQLAIGRLYLQRCKDHFHIIDIALLPEYQGKGTGNILIQAIQAEAATLNMSVCLQVEKNNRAQRLYRRLGFQQTGNEGMHFQMRWEQ